MILKLYSLIVFISKYFLRSFYIIFMIRILCFIVYKLQYLNLDACCVFIFDVFFCYKFLLLILKLRLLHFKMIINRIHNFDLEISNRLYTFLIHGVYAGNLLAYFIFFWHIYFSRCLFFCRAVSAAWEVDLYRFVCKFCRGFT